MRVEVIKCDMCKKEHDTQYYIPAEWITMTQRGKYNDGDDQHFCSKACLITWASEGDVANERLDHVDDCMKMIGISLNLLDPQGLLGSPGGTFEQMGIMKTVKEDWVKLSDAILSLRRTK
jgi:hypothetical protein